MPVPPVPVDSFISSDVFQFFVGPEARPFSIHKGILLRLSEPLRMLVEGEMREATESTYAYRDGDADTLERFAEWAYTGDYKAAVHTVAHMSINVEEPLLVTKSGERDAAVAQRKKAPVYIPYATLPRKGRPGSLVAHRVRELPARKKRRVERNSTVEGSEVKEGIRPNNSADEDYTEVFLSHAKLYVFANQQQIEPLAKLAIEKLQATLDRFTVYEERRADILHLAQYAYANTFDRGDNINDLKWAVLSFLLRDTVGFRSCRLFGELMENAVFARDLVWELGEMTVWYQRKSELSPDDFLATEDEGDAGEGTEPKVDGDKE